MLKPDDNYDEQRTNFGCEMDSSDWESALKQGMRAPASCRKRVLQPLGMVASSHSDSVLAKSAGENTSPALQHFSQAV